MNKEKAYVRAANVLFYGSLDEPFALKRAIQATRENSDLEQIKALYSLLSKKQGSTQSHVHAKGIEDDRIKVKKSLRLDYWREFKYNSTPDILFPVLFKWIGGFSDADIRKALGLSEGTLMMRYNSALIKLGGYLIKGVGVE